MTTAADRTARDVPVPAGFDVRPYISPIGSDLAGAANFIMQLAWPGVGYGVLNSRVHDGSALRHPIKRARTTFTYLAVALLGTDADRAAYRQAVTRQHAQVYSLPGEPVTYRAMDPRLQTWVAACLYFGTLDIREKLHGPLDDAESDALYAYCARFGTTLQMPASAWPADRTAFAAYWEESLSEVRIDPPVRDLLLKLTTLQNLGGWTRPLAARRLFVTTGFLPASFREAMDLPWTGSDQRRFERSMRRLGRLEARLPQRMRTLPFDLLLADMRRRQRRSRPLV